MKLKIELYSKPGCKFCKLAKDYLEAHDLPFKEIIYEDYDRRQKMYDSFGLFNGRRTVPQIVINGVRIGGYGALKEYKLPVKSEK